MSTKSAFTDSSYPCCTRRPRSRPPTVAETGKRPEHVPQSTKLQAASASLQMPPSIRLTRSIPILRTRVSDETALSPISRDKDGFYRPAGSSAGQPIENGFLALPVESSYHVLRTENTSGQLRKSLLQNAVSIPNLRAHRDNDIFGKLLGWSDPSNPVLDAPTSGPSRPSPTSKSSRSPPRDIASSHTAEASSAHARPSFEGGLHTPLNQSFPYDLPPDLHEASQSSIQQREVLKSTPTSSPFGQGVRLPSQPRLKRKKSLRQLHGTIMAPAAEERANNTFDSLDSFDPSFKVRAIREVGSSETIRTAKGPNMPSAGEPDMPPLDSPRTPLAVPSLDTWMSDTRIFDSLQCNDSTAPVGELRDSLKPTSEASGRRHEVGIISPVT